MGNVPPANGQKKKWSFFVDNLVILRIGCPLVSFHHINNYVSNGKYRDSLQTKNKHQYTCYRNPGAHRNAYTL